VQIRSEIGKKRDFGVHFGANLRVEISLFWPFSKDSAFIFNRIVASLVSKNNLFFFSSALPFQQAFRLPLMRRLVRTLGSE
jgi:hypothetical protein